MNKRILVVDDEKDIRRVVQISLEKFAGWKVILAESGEEALLKAKIHKSIDAILLDVSMPEMDGFQVFDRLRSNVATESIPVILLTAKVLPSDRQRFDKMGVAGVITKPFDPMTVWKQLTDILGW
ncbi:MAG: two-component system response regulator [Hapalosiphonaceae cyanobacterium JJU2]|nr:MAG: two-component system response regulator [Hapalosiphonaceae cyanobacterium JJU2]